MEVGYAFCMKLFGTMAELRLAETAEETSDTSNGIETTETVAPPACLW